MAAVRDVTSEGSVEADMAASDLVVAMVARSNED